VTVSRYLNALTLIALVATAVFIGSRSAPTPGLAASPGSATFTVVSPVGSTPLGNSVDVPVDLSSFTPGTSTTWGGYDLELKYDGSPGVVTATNDVIGPSNPCGFFWANNALVPHVVSGCAFQASTFTGTLETITFQCLADGVAPIHIVLRTDSGKEGTGSGLFDATAIDFDMTMVDGSITCGTGGPTSTPTATATSTNTPTPTNSPTATSTAPTATPTSTATPGGPATICSTNVGGPPTLGSGLDCDTDTRFGGVLGDGCVDSEDANPLDPWDFYSVPVPALLAAASPTTTFRDNAVTPFDAQAVFRYFLAGASAGMPVYEQDLNQNGVKDGWEYDRSEDVNGVLGAPDGVVTARDAQAAMGQFAAGKSCTSGYNLQRALCTTNVGGPPTLGNGYDCDQAVAFPGILGDGCVDSEDANPNDPWTLYSVPVPALYASPSALRDNIVTVQDAQAVFAYFAMAAHAGAAIYDQDLNLNGVPDGWEYDRSVLGPLTIGPPDGVVTAQDAQAAFTQFKNNRRCTSGYNMKNTAP
jgi:hypothetical protein